MKDIADSLFTSTTDYLAERLREGLRESGRNAGHLKFFAKASDEDLIKGSLVGIDAPTSYDCKLDGRYPKLTFILNARTVRESNTMEEILTDAYGKTREKSRLSSQVIFSENWGMMDEGAM